MGQTCSGANCTSEQFSASCTDDRQWCGTGYYNVQQKSVHGESERDESIALNNDIATKTQQRTAQHRSG
jgi:hypothetical protein